MRYRSAVEGDTSGTHLGVGEGVPEWQLMRFSVVDFASVSVAKIRQDQELMISISINTSGKLYPYCNCILQQTMFN